MSDASVSPAQVGRRIFDKRALVGSLILCVLLCATSYGRMAEFAGVVGILFLKVLFNIWVDRWLIPHKGGTPGERVRMAVNVLGLLFIGHLQAWSLAVWLWLPFHAMITEEKRARRAYLNLAALIAVLDVAALVDGTPPMLPLGFSALAVVCYLQAQARQCFIEGLLQEQEQQNARLQKAHRELEAMHQLAVMQEKLSSLGLLAAGIAHEINNPMSYVTSNVQALVSDLPAFPRDASLVEEYQREVLPATLDGLKRVNAIVADLRRFARGDPESLVEYNLNEEIRAAARLAQSRFVAGRELRLQLGELPTLLGRPRQMTQVLVNLLVNAAQAIDEKGAVTVSTGLEDGKIRVSVRDTGKGMDAGTLKHLFEPFFTTKPVGEGTGLGLAVVHGLVRSQGGTISVESEPGRGSCFTLLLPQFPPPHLPLGQEPPEWIPVPGASPAPM